MKEGRKEGQTQAKTGIKNGFFPFAGGHGTQAKRITTAESPTSPQKPNGNIIYHLAKDNAIQAKRDAKKGQKLHPSKNPCKAHGQKCPCKAHRETGGRATGQEGRKQGTPPHDKTPTPPCAKGRCAFDPS